MAQTHGGVAFSVQSIWFHPKDFTFHYLANKAKSTHYGETVPAQVTWAIVSVCVLSNTTFIDRIAGAGEGPGELRHPITLALAGDVLFIADHDRFHLFSLRGSFLRTVRTPADLFIKRAGQSWLGLFGFQFGQANQPLNLFMLDVRFSNRVSLGTWTSENDRGTRLLTPKGINPVEAVTLLRIDRSARYAYVKPEGLDEISIFDLQT